MSVQNYWSFHNSKMIELKKKYNKIDKQTRNRLQEIFNRFEITSNNLYLYVSSNVKKQINTYIEEWTTKKIDDDYFKVLLMSIYSKDKVTYAEILELLIYEAYIEQQIKEKDEEDSLFFALFAFYYMEGQKEVNNALSKEKKKKYSTFNEDMFLTLMTMPNALGYIYEDYKKSIAKYNSEQILRQATINIMQGKELKIDSGEFQNIIDKQQKAKLNINGDKISGAVDNTLIGMNNQAKVMGISAIQPDAKVKFIAVTDEKSTKMCQSLNGQIFSVRDWNEFKRYSDLHQGSVKYRCRGLVTGLNLPPINDNFHYCRSTIIYVANSKETSYNELEIPKTLKIQNDVRNYIVSNNIVYSKKIERLFEKYLIDDNILLKNNQRLPFIYNLDENKIIIDFNNKDIDRYNIIESLTHEIMHMIDKRDKLLDNNSIIYNLVRKAKNNILLNIDEYKKVFQEENYFYNMCLGDTFNMLSDNQIKTFYFHDMGYPNIEDEILANISTIEFLQDEKAIELLNKNEYTKKLKEEVINIYDKYIR